MRHHNSTAAPLAALMNPIAGIATSLAWPLAAVGADVPFAERVISTTETTPSSVFATDLDRDGDIDILFMSGGDDKIAWYESDGGKPPIFTRRVIAGTATVWYSLFAADVDGDGDTDVLSASYDDDKIAWYESDGGKPPTFTEHVISGAADGAASVFAMDVDGDGDIDVLSASSNDNKIAWYENDGGSPPTFTARLIYQQYGASSVFATDLDRDGDTDVLSAAGSDSATLNWYVNDGGSPPTFTKRAVSMPTATGVSSVFATDLDGDGDTDILYTSLAKIAWFESDGASPPSFTERVILSTTPIHAHTALATDLDGDGDTDVLATLPYDSKIWWYENYGGSPTRFYKRSISTTAFRTPSVFAADIDGDGKTDLIAALRPWDSSAGTKIAWYENLSPCGFDSDCDGDVDLEDYVPFRAALFGPR